MEKKGKKQLLSSAMYKGENLLRPETQFTSETCSVSQPPLKVKLIRPAVGQWLALGVCMCVCVYGIASLPQVPSEKDLQQTE